MSVKFFSLLIILLSPFILSVYSKATDIHTPGFTTAGVDDKFNNDRNHNLDNRPFAATVFNEKKLLADTIPCLITGSGIICQGTSIQLCAPVGFAAYLWGNGATTRCISVTAAGTYKVTVTDSSGNTGTCTKTVVVRPLPGCIITGPSVICQGSANQLCAPAGLSSYSWSTGATTRCIPITTGGTYTVTVTDSNGCRSTCSRTVTLRQLPVCTITGPSVICQNDSVQVCATATGASYSWSTGATTRCILVVAAGTYTVTVTDSFGCKSTCSKTLVLRPHPNCTITGNSTICFGTSTQLCAPAGLSGYAWSTGATTQCISVTAAGTYTVTVTDSNGCKSTCSRTVTVKSLPNCNITGSTTICQGSSTQLCAHSGLSAYSWSTGATTQCITVTTAGTYTVTVTDSSGCRSTCSRTVTVRQLPICSITGPSVICQNDSVQICATTTTGVFYSWNTGATTRCILVVAAGTYTVTVTDSFGCKSTCSRTLVVRPRPNCTITGNSTICFGTSTQLCAPAGLSGYAWSTGATTQCISVTAAGTYTVTVTDSNGCKSTCSRTVTVRSLPNCNISGSTTICQGSSTQLCAPSGLSAYSWSTGATTQCITVNAAGTYTVTVTDSNVCRSTCSRTVTLRALPVCTITGPSVICQNDSVQLCATATSGVFYSWNTGATTRCILVVAAGTYTVTVTDSFGCKSTCGKTLVVRPHPNCNITGNGTICAGTSTQLCAPARLSGYAWSTGATTQCISVTAAGTYTVTVTDSNGCRSTCSRTVTVRSLPNCNITGSTAICQGSSTQLCAPSGLSAYSWSTGATTQCITVTTAGTYTVTVTDSNGCRSTCSRTVTVRQLPGCTITGPSVICQNDSIQLCAPAGPFFYSWNTGATTRCILVVAAGTYTVTVTDSFGCKSTCSKTVVVRPHPNCNITGNGTICAGTSTQLCAPAGLSGYAWSTGATTQCISVTAAGTYTVTVTDSNGCRSTCSKTVTIRQLPNCTITGSGTICQGSSTQLCAPSGLSAYSWSTGATTQCVTVTAAGTYTVTVTDSNGCRSTCSRTVTVRQLPVCTITGPSVICQNDSVQLCATATSGVFYSWNTGATTRCILVVAAGTYTVTVTDSFGCKSTCSRTLVVRPHPNCTITGSSTICFGTSTQLCAPAGLSSYAWSTGATTQCISVTAAGTYTVTVTDSNGCRSTCSRTVTVRSLPNCNITGSPTICQGSSTQLCAPSGLSAYSWSTGATTQCVTVTAAGTYTVTVTDSNGCRSTCSRTVTLRALPVCTITGPSVICQNDSVQLCATATSGVFYSWNTGATTRCILVVAAGTYTVTVTDSFGCKSTCSKTLVVRPRPNCTITGNSTICFGTSTQLCAPAGLSGYAWSTGATTQCISVTAAGTYTVTVTDSNGCRSTCSRTVTVRQLPSCVVSGNSNVCQGSSSSFCAPTGLASYSWSTGATARCITVTAAGTYTVTLTDSFGCKSTCSKVAVLRALPNCTITGSDSINQGGSTQLCAPAGLSSYAWSTGATTQCITVTAAGTYTVTVTDVNGCKSTCSKTVTIHSLFVQHSSPVKQPAFPANQLPAAAIINRR